MTGEDVVVSGDSAGGNLALVLLLKLQESPIDLSFIGF